MVQQRSVEVLGRLYVGSISKDEAQALLGLCQSAYVLVVET